MASRDTVGSGGGGSESATPILSDVTAFGLVGAEWMGGPARCVAGSEEPVSPFDSVSNRSSRAVSGMQVDLVGTCAGLLAQGFSHQAAERMVLALFGSLSGGLPATPTVSSFGTRESATSRGNKNRERHFARADALARKDGYCYLWLVRSSRRAAAMETLGPRPTFDMLFTKLPCDYLAVGDWRNVWVQSLGGCEFHLSRGPIAGARPFLAVLAATVASFGELVPAGWRSAVAETEPDGSPFPLTGVVGGLPVPECVTQYVEVIEEECECGARGFELVADYANYGHKCAHTVDTGLAPVVEVIVEEMDAFVSQDGPLNSEVCVHKMGDDEALYMVLSSSPFWCVGDSSEKFDPVGPDLGMTNVLVGKFEADEEWVRLRHAGANDPGWMVVLQVEFSELHELVKVLQSAGLLNGAYVDSAVYEYVTTVQCTYAHVSGRNKIGLGFSHSDYSYLAALPVGNVAKRAAYLGYGARPRVGDLVSRYGTSVLLNMLDVDGVVSVDCDGPGEQLNSVVSKPSISYDSVVYGFSGFSA